MVGRARASPPRCGMQHTARPVPPCPWAKCAPLHAPSMHAPRMHAPSMHAPTPAPADRKRTAYEAGSRSAGAYQYRSHNANTDWARRETDWTAGGGRGGYTSRMSGWRSPSCLCAAAARPCCGRSGGKLGCRPLPKALRRPLGCPPPQHTHTHTHPLALQQAPGRRCGAACA